MEQERRRGARPRTHDPGEQIIDDLAYNSPTLQRLTEMVGRHEKSFEKMSDKLVDVVGRVEIMRERQESSLTAAAALAHAVSMNHDNIDALQRAEDVRTGEARAVKLVVAIVGVLNAAVGVGVGMLVLLHH